MNEFNKYLTNSEIITELDKLSQAPPDAKRKLLEQLEARVGAGDSDAALLFAEFSITSKNIRDLAKAYLYLNIYYGENGYSTKFQNVGSGASGLYQGTESDFRILEFPAFAHDRIPSHVARIMDAKADKWREKFSGDNGIFEFPWSE